KAAVDRDLVVQPNTMIMEHAHFHPFVTVGRNTIVWSATRVAFRGRIGDHCWLVSPMLGESVTMGDYTVVGLNATIAPSLTIGRANVIGAGALIMKSTADAQVFRGHPSVAASAPSTRLWL